MSDDRLRECLRFVGQAAQTRPLMEHLREREAEIINTMAEASETCWIYRMQGSLAEVRRLLDLIRQAVEE